ncbi:hypothetical protein SLS64_007766 [Diaporthe eres]|uniref:Glucose-methanol-choline oxidoreductase C-terminal domain-containing protein n=1 Tax=Diaporthe eres TaxID=83184 RepID=A0ABR1P658_DIAER
MSASTPLVGHPGEGIPLTPKEILKEKIELLRKQKKVYEADVLIVGSGPIGAVFARKLVDGGKKVLMIDMGEQASKRVGDHRKNSVAVQKDISLFTNIIKGELAPLSVSVAESSTRLPPDWIEQMTSHDPPAKKKFILNAQNPDQDRDYNLAASAATRTVGGMAAHWTCCTPRQYPEVFKDAPDKGHRERSDLFTDEEWKDLYNEAEGLFNTNDTTFDDSVRHALVRWVLKDAFGPDGAGNREVKSMPLACKHGKSKNHIEWSCTATILGDKWSKPGVTDKDTLKARPFTVLPQTQLDVMLINDDGNGGAVEGAIIIDLETDEQYLVEAKRYVICGGIVLTAGIMAKSLFKSGLEVEENGHVGHNYLPALGKYLTEQTMTFCQVVLKKKHVEMVEKTPWEIANGNQKIIDAVKKHLKNHPDDPLPFPFDDLDPNVYTPFSEKYPWHTQIHRDAFGYGEVPADIDQRLIVDLRFFGYIDPNEHNKITFSTTRRDGFGMPQVRRSICGVYRAGKEVSKEGQEDQIDLEKTKKTSVVDKSGLVWGVSNLYLGGCGVIPTGNASNPTLTAACHAIYGARRILAELNGEGH